MQKVKTSIAVLIRKGEQILSTRRRDDDDELPGIWGLPAGTLQPAETREELIRRIGREKLGVELKPVQCIAAGAQDRPAYRLEMELWEAAMVGTPMHSQWQWASMDLLRPGMAAGSLCCKLAIQSKNRAG
jgi:8-oxo-dGTP diphosphatase